MQGSLSVSGLVEVVVAYICVAKEGATRMTTLEDLMEKQYAAPDRQIAGAVNIQT